MIKILISPSISYSFSQGGGSVKLEQSVASTDITSAGGTTTTANTTSSHERQKNFTHYSDIRVEMDLDDDKLFESDTSDTSDDENQVNKSGFVQFLMFLVRFPHYTMFLSFGEIGGFLRLLLL